jgi:hypothetical protein
MARCTAATDLLAFMMKEQAHARAARYREEAKKLRSMAAAETTVPLRNSLLHLARQYEELAANLSGRQRPRTSPTPAEVGRLV